MLREVSFDKGRVEEINVSTQASKCSNVLVYIFYVCIEDAHVYT